MVVEERHNMWTDGLLSKLIVYNDASFFNFKTDQIVKLKIMILVGFSVC